MGAEIGVTGSARRCLTPSTLYLNRVMIAFNGYARNAVPRNQKNQTMSPRIESGIQSYMGKLGQKDRGNSGEKSS